MAKLEQLLKERRTDEIWQLCCGFVDLTLDQFMSIQKNLLLEQIQLLSKCELGRRILNGPVPTTVDEFRRRVPLTTYVDYCPDLLERKEDTLPAKPVRWTQTSGKGGEYPFKWIPISERFWEEAGLDFAAVAIFGSCHRRGEINIKHGMKILCAASSPPTLTNAVAHRLADDLQCLFLPSLDEAETLRFEQRVEKGFQIALSEGIDAFFGLGGVLVAIGKKFTDRSSNVKKMKYIRDPRALLRLAKGKIKSRREKRPMMPKDLWNLTNITSMGTDSVVFSEKIHELWGKWPLNVYGNTEATLVATQTWDYRDMVFFPNLNFLEFIPRDENHHAPSTDRHLKTLLLNEVQPGQTYELVITNFHGGALVRYRTGELIRITSLENRTLGVRLPQMINEGRVDDLIDLGFMRLNERVIWQGLEKTGILYKDWTARKELGGAPRLHLYLELANGYCTSSQNVADRLYQEIKKLNDGLYVYTDISSIENLIGFQPIKVTLLPSGSFATFKQLRQAEGAATQDFRPPHINPSQFDIDLLNGEARSVPERWAETILGQKVH